MRWFSRRTPTGGRHAAGAHAAGAGVLRPSTAPPVTVVPVPLAPVTVVPVPLAPVTVAPVTGSGVYLGFADGVVLQLDASDPRARTFRSLARSLAQGAT